MLTHQFPGCCTGIVFTELGGSHTAIGGYKEYTQEQVEKFIISSVKRYHDKGIFVATTNDDQTIAINALRKLGFKRTKWTSKKAHGNTRICMWWISIEDWEAKHGKVSRFTS